MMKRYIYIIGVALAVAAFLSGCVKQESAWSPTNIAFKPLIGHDTRAVESVPFPQDRNFKVWAMSPGAGETYIDGEEISYDADGWVSSKKWPIEPLDFHAYWPTDLDVDFTLYNGLQIRDFDCRQGNVDILIAHGFSSDDNDDAAILRFDHILSRVEFRMLHSLSENMSVRLKKIEMKGFAGIGDYNVKKKDGWTSSAYDYDYVVYDAGNTEGIEITSVTAQYIGHEFYVIPQPCAASLEVTYDVRYNNANWVPQTEVIDNLETYWEPSKHYTYTVNLRMDKLTHTTGISSWSNKD